MGVEDEAGAATRRWVGNLHDVFLNASLARSGMLPQPVADDPKKFMTSPRGRFERMWVTFLYVLVEAWGASVATSAREYVRTVTDTSALEALLEQGRADGTVDRMRETRHYMCHRDAREYFDTGRLAPIGALAYHEELHAAFGAVLLAALRAAMADRSDS